MAEGGKVDRGVDEWFPCETATEEEVELRVERGWAEGVRTKNSLGEHGFGFDENGT